ncbi:MAG: aminotransferase class V-fold PLP-dependent enzyme [Chloroflexaceae bacterium]|nr:aminotransferase class V-fold PLP-dependent enzyme [Chloroflexaceae bacterium]
MAGAAPQHLRASGADLGASPCDVARRGQERDLRAGTLYPPQIVGFAKAVELALSEEETEAQRQTHLRNRLWETLKQLDGIHLNGHPTQRLPNNLNISIEGVNGSALHLALQPTLALSAGSACSSGKTAPSHVLKALGRPDSLAYASLRFGLGRFTTPAEIDQAAQMAIAAIEDSRRARLTTP